MLDQKVLELARKIIHPQFAERRDVLEGELRATARRLNAKGLLRSGVFVSQVLQLGASEIKLRIRLAQQHLVRVVTETNVPRSNELEQDLMHELRIHAAEARESVTHQAIAHLKSMEEKFQEMGRPAIAEAEGRGLEIAAGEIGIFAHRYNQPQEGAPPRTVVNVAGSVGVMQTGDWATSHATQRFGPDEKQLVTTAIEALRQYLQDHRDGTEELAGVVDEVDTEIRKEKPNRLRLGSLLSGVSVTIQTVAAAQPAYQAVMAVLHMLGVS